MFRLVHEVNFHGKWNSCGLDVRFLRPRAVWRGLGGRGRLGCRWGHLGSRSLASVETAVKLRCGCGSGGAGGHGTV